MFTSLCFNPLRLIFYFEPLDISDCYLFPWMPKLFESPPFIHRIHYSIVLLHRFLHKLCQGCSGSSNHQKQTEAAKCTVICHRTEGGTRKSTAGLEREILHTETRNSHAETTKGVGRIVVRWA